jgi:hypothetical protein
VRTYYTRERERERERESVCERERECVCVRERDMYFVISTYTSVFAMILFTFNPCPSLSHTFNLSLSLSIYLSLTHTLTHSLSLSIYLKHTLTRSFSFSLYLPLYLTHLPPPPKLHISFLPEAFALDLFVLHINPSLSPLSSLLSPLSSLSLSSNLRSPPLPLPHSQCLEPSHAVFVFPSIQGVY